MYAEFYSKMDEEERLGIIGHEVWHCALRHFQRLGNRDRKKFNFACDVEVDLLLHRDGFKVEVLPHEASWEGKSAEQIYDLMFPGLEQFQKNDEHIFDSDKLSGDADGENEGDNSDGEKADNNTNETDSKNSDQGECQSENDGKSQGSNSGGKPITGDADLPSVSHDGVIDPDFQPGMEDELAEDWKDHLKNAVQQEMKKSGKGIGILPGNVEDLIKDEGKTASIDWKKFCWIMFHSFSAEIVSGFLRHGVMYGKNSICQAGQENRVLKLFLPLIPVEVQRKICRTSLLNCGE